MGPDPSGPILAYETCPCAIRQQPAARYRAVIMLSPRRRAYKSSLGACGRLFTFLAAVAMTLGAESEVFDHVTYLGHNIPLSRAYADFHEYRDDPNNLPKSV